MDSSGRLRMETVCFFCGNGGQSEVRGLGYFGPHDSNLKHLFAENSINMNGKIFTVGTYFDMNVERARRVKKECGDICINAVDRFALSLEEALNVKWNI